MTDPEDQGNKWGEGRGNGGSIPPVEYRFQPGKSGNPGGRPKGLSVTAEIRALLAQDHNGKRIAKLVAERLIKEALSGKHAHLQILLDRTEGGVNHKLRVEAADSTERQLISTAEMFQLMVQGVPPEFRSGVYQKVKALVTQRIAENQRRRGIERTDDTEDTDG